MLLRSVFLPKSTVFLGDLDNVVVVHRRAAVNALSVDSDAVLAVVVKHDPAGRGAPQNGVLTRGCKIGQPHHGVLSAADGDIDQPAHVKEPPRFVVAQSGAKDHNDALGVRTVEGLAVNAENIAVGQTERARAAVVIGLQLDAVDIGSVQAVIINIVVSSLAVIIQKLAVTSADDRRLDGNLTLRSVIQASEGHVAVQRHNARTAAAVDDEQGRRKRRSRRIAHRLWYLHLIAPLSGSK